MTDAALIARLEALEATCAHQDRIISELSDQIAQQWRRIDLQTREILRLREQMDGMAQSNAPDRRPPHY